MKRSYIKRKPKKPRKHPSAQRKVQDELWELCKQIIRLMYGNTCFTCGKTGLTGSGWHTAHLIPRSTCGAFLKYDLRNLRPCCYHCNINLGGNGAIFYRRMVETEGQKYVDDIFKDKEKIVVASEHYQKLLIEYDKRAISTGHTENLL